MVSVRHIREVGQPRGILASAPVPVPAASSGMAKHGLDGAAGVAALNCVFRQATLLRPSGEHLMISLMTSVVF